MNALRPRLAIAGAAALFSTGGAAIKACSFSGWQVACLRSLVAGVSMVLLLPRARRGWSWRGLPVGLAYASTMILFVQANKLTTAANTIFLQSAAPLYVLLLAPLLLGERVTKNDVLLMTTIALGLGLCLLDVEDAGVTALRPVLGNALAACSGLSWALTLLGLRWLARATADQPAALSSLTAVVTGNLLASAISLPMALPFASPSLADTATIGYLGVFQIGLAYVLLTRGFEHISAFEASLLILIEPALSPVWAWIVHGELPGAWALSGGATILAATAAKAWLEQRARRLSADRSKR